MILGQSAATAAVMAIDDGIAVQDVAYEKLRTQLEADGQVLSYSGPVRGGHREDQIDLQGAQHVARLALRRPGARPLGISPGIGHAAYGRLPPRSSGRSCA